MPMYGGGYMVLDLRPLLRGETSRIDIDYYLTPEPIEGVTFDSDAHVKGYVTDNAGYMHLVLEAEVGYKGECARCLAPVTGTYRTVFERTVCEEKSLSEEKAKESEDDVYGDEYAVIKNGMLDIDEELREELLLGFPTRLLCSEDCPGLCPKCGKPKREGKCDCPEREIDPRLAVLKTLLRKDGGNEDKAENR